MLISLPFARPTGAADYVVAQNEVLEVTLESSGEYSNPYLDITVDMIVQNGEGKKQHVPAFWAGDACWKIRYSAHQVGELNYVTACSNASDRGLHNQRGTITVKPYEGANELLSRGPLAIDARHNVVHADGTPFLWLADSWWHGMTTRFKWPEDVRTLTRDRKEKGFSVIQFAIGFPCDIAEFDPRGANEAGFPISHDYRKINPAYFDLVDLRVRHLVDCGLVPNILGSWGYYLNWFGVDNMRHYWRYIIARYGAYPVTWTVAGETTLTYYRMDNDRREEVRQYQRDGWADVARYIKDTDPFGRIVTAHPGPDSGRYKPISDMTLLDLVMVQPGHSGWESLPTALRHLKTAQARFPDKPVMQGEVCFEGMHGGGSDAKLQRILFWTNMLSGAAGHCYGADAIWQFNTEEELFGPTAGPGGHVWGNWPWEEAYQWKGSFYVGLGRKILQQFDWQQFEPHPEWIDPAADDDDVQDAYAAGIGGKIRMFYFPRGVMPWGQDYTALELDAGTTYLAVYIDPLTGDHYPLAEPISGVRSWKLPHAPILQDWLLTLQVQE